VSGLRDYEVWHQAYDDPESGLSWRLRTVQLYLREALDRRPGPLTVLSSCSGDGRDLLGVLSERRDADRVSATLIELHPDIAQRARDTAAAAGLARIDVRTADAGHTESYRGAVPADVVILVGIFGNISDPDLHRTIKAAPQFCGPGATLLWSRGREWGDRNDAVRAWFAAAGFTELDYMSLDSGSRPALGVMRFDGEPQRLAADQRLFTFRR
jgi:hypothetical protein